MRIGAIIDLTLALEFGEMPFAIEPIFDIWLVSETYHIVQYLIDDTPRRF